MAKNVFKVFRIGDTVTHDPNALSGGVEYDH